VRVYVTGASGFVGSNIARVFEANGAELATPSHGDVDVTDPDAVGRSVAQFRPDAIVHSAILNDFAALYADRRAGWDAYVGATRNLVEAANDGGARMVLVSTDWVFDGTQAGATERTPPNPINLYGFLKAASELVVTERAERGSVARIAAVQGWPSGAGAGAPGGAGAGAPGGAGAPAARALPREQDAGFGYFVPALVERLRAGERFGVWESDAINMVATPTLASDAAELIWRIAERDLDGIFHCCGGEAVDRRTLAMRAAQVFELDPTLLDLGVRPPDGALPGPESGSPGPDRAPGRRAAAVPYDTSLDATWTAAALDVELPSVTEMLHRMCEELTPA
jgi:dTDP-4-dehydrorhamnose reductase